MLKIFATVLPTVKLAVQQMPLRRQESNNDRQSLDMAEPDITEPFSQLRAEAHLKSVESRSINLHRRWRPSGPSLSSTPVVAERFSGPNALERTPTKPPLFRDVTSPDHLLLSLSNVEREQPPMTTSSSGNN